MDPLYIDDDTDTSDAAPLTLRDAIREAFESALDSPDRVALSDVVDTVMDEYGDIVARDAQTLIRGQMMKLAKAIARSAAEQDSRQMALFGFPLVLALPVSADEDDFQYIRASNAVWGDLVSARTIRASNVERAQAKLDAYDEALNSVRPVMEGTDLTLADASARLGVPA